MQSLARRLENGGVLTCTGVCRAAQPFFAVLLQNIFSHRPIVVVVEDLKTQESFLQDMETWLFGDRKTRVEGREQLPSGENNLQPSTFDLRPLFYPAWEILPHEGKLPHADTISDRLQTLAALAAKSQISNLKSQIVVTSVTALLQRTFARMNCAPASARSPAATGPIRWTWSSGWKRKVMNRKRRSRKKEKSPCAAEFLMSGRSQSPWPVRLEFFGDELESLRTFDPLTQISREEIAAITIPPAGELGITEVQEVQSPKSKANELATLLDYLPRETIFLLCEPEQLVARADEYRQQVPADDPFFISWTDFLAALERRGMTRIELGEVDDRLESKLQLVPGHAEA